MLRLPNELLTLIFEHLSTKEWKQLRLVRRVWSSLVGPLLFYRTAVCMAQPPLAVCVPAYFLTTQPLGVDATYSAMVHELVIYFHGTQNEASQVPSLQTAFPNVERVLVVLQDDWVHCPLVDHSPQKSTFTISSLYRYGTWHRLRDFQWPTVHAMSLHGDLNTYAVHNDFLRCFAHVSHLDISNYPLDFFVFQNLQARCVHLESLACRIIMSRYLNQLTFGLNEGHMLPGDGANAAKGVSTKQWRNLHTLEVTADLYQDLALRLLCYIAVTMPRLAQLAFATPKSALPVRQQSLLLLYRHFAHILARNPFSKLTHATMRGLHLTIATAHLLFLNATQLTSLKLIDTPSRFCTNVITSETDSAVSIDLENDNADMQERDQGQQDVQEWPSHLLPMAAPRQLHLHMAYTNAIPSLLDLASSQVAAHVEHLMITSSRLGGRDDEAQKMSARRPLDVYFKTRRDTSNSAFIQSPHVERDTRAPSPAFMPTDAPCFPCLKHITIKNTTIDDTRIFPFLTIKDDVLFSATAPPPCSLKSVFLQKCRLHDDDTHVLGAASNSAFSAGPTSLLSLPDNARLWVDLLRTFPHKDTRLAWLWFPEADLDHCCAHQLSLIDNTGHWKDDPVNTVLLLQTAPWHHNATSACKVVYQDPRSPVSVCESALDPLAALESVRTAIHPLPVRAAVILCCSANSLQATFSTSSPL
ncbi:hypothetical protein BC940DRAFT_311002 [Gongronella butleri]|nr:hypothetical protein BC940DRAFT_311002 [Gongronella butleri]